MKISQYKSNKPAYQKKLNITQPPLNSTAVFEWETFEKISDFTDAHLFAVFTRISRDIIERPYHYHSYKIYDNCGNELPNRYFNLANNDAPPAKLVGGTVYKQNHGTGHALRQMIYADRLVTSILNHGNANGRIFAMQVLSNPEIDKALKLAAFCKRLGRTLDNEHDYPSANLPTIYSKRSADIFALIANELGFDTKLIGLLQQSMLEPMPAKYTNTSQISRYDFLSSDFRQFCANILMASHKADLVRIFSVSKSLVKNELAPYFDHQIVNSAVKSLIEHACQLNSSTGNPVVGQETGIEHKPRQLNGRRLAYVVENLDTFMPNLVSKQASISYDMNYSITSKHLHHAENFPKATTPSSTTSELKDAFCSYRLSIMQNESFIFFRRTGLTNQKIANMSFADIIEYAQTGSRWYSANRTAQILITMGVLDEARKIMPDYKHILETEHDSSIYVI